MNPHPALRKDLVDRLRAQLGAEEEPSPPPEPPRDQGAGKGLKKAIKRVIRRAIAWYVDPAAQKAAREAAAWVDERLTARIADLEQRAWLADEIQALTINLELMKGELRTLQETIEELGMSIAPGTGLPGAASRLAELRERLTAVERRTRGQPAPSPATSPARRRAETPATRVLDYVGLERRFRGDPDAILTAVKERYLDMLRGHPPVLDVGCGKGELLEALAQEGVEGLGVDFDSDMVAEGRAKGLEVHEGDGLAFLRSRKEYSLGSIIAIHVAEHLELGDLVEFLQLVATRLRPGGLFIAETPNPASLIVLGNSYVLDPTHVRPLHPSLMVFLCESAGFRDVQLRFYSPAEGYHLPLIDDPEAPQWAQQINRGFEKLNQVLFGPQEYAVIATTPPSTTFS